MAAVRNILFIMCDQLRADHLGCYGHPYLATRNLDALAARGVRFDRAFVQSGVCGPSRMSFYTGRYMSSHGATWNRAAFGRRDHARRISARRRAHAGALGQDARAERHRRNGAPATRRRRRWAPAGRRGLSSSSIATTAISRTGSPYAAYLREHGYTGDDPWSDYVISATDHDGRIVSGWHMQNAHLPARVAESHSETAYTTDRALDFIRTQGDRPWVLHLSYVKPHWPYLAPAPYHARYTLGQCLPVKRDARELQSQHPVLAAYRQQEECVNFARDEVWQTVRPTYQGLVQQIDDHLGRVWKALDRLGRFADTLIVFTSDHGDFLGDHWLGEKEQFYDTVQRVPLSVYDPAAAADATRGHVETRFVEGVDLTPTFLDALELPIATERIEGASLLPLTRGGAVPAWRAAVFSELAYGYREARRISAAPPGPAAPGWCVPSAGSTSTGRISGRSSRPRRRSEEFDDAVMMPRSRPSGARCASGCSSGSPAPEAPRHGHRPRGRLARCAWRGRALPTVVVVWRLGNSLNSLGQPMCPGRDRT
jgi:arylsulfatase A-like enzyme